MRNLCEVCKHGLREKSTTVWLIEKFYYVTFWHSKVKTDTFIKYHIQVYELKYTIKKHQFDGKHNDEHHS